MDTIQSWKSEQVNEISAALAKAQGQMRGALKDAKNPHLGNKYADLASVWEACRDALTANGLAIAQLPSAAASLVTVRTVLMHASGQWISSELTLPASPISKKGDDGPGKPITAQSIGSAITYARRYGLAAIVGVAPEDDDGDAASYYDRTPQRDEPRREEPRRDDPPRQQAPTTQTRAVADAALLAKLRADATAKVRPGDVDAAIAWWDSHLEELSKLAHAQYDNVKAHVADISNATARPQEVPTPTQNGGGPRREMRL